MINTTKIFLLMAAMSGLFMVAGQVLGGQNGMVMAFVVALGMNFFAYWFSDTMALKMSRAREVSSAEAPELHALVERLAVRALLPKPRVYIMPGETPNAFATGRNPEHAAVAVTEGLLRLLNSDELEGVMAHELAHIKNRDILISSIAAVMAGAISYMATMAQWAMIFGGGRGRDEEGGGGGLIGSLAMMIIAPMAAALIQMAISRSREYVADATGAEICGKPQGLASALNRLEQYNRQRPMQVNPATAQMYIVNPLSGQTISRLFSTHPPIQERIKRLEAI
ncbi:MAG: zinc metalloprotease HtpX [Desulfobulbaceae bacterium]|uniref:Protease HtpX homolog n=1 Tax=Candidatus Desulfobia pelagia TaxID=2841692 RepID=A0A8J6NDD9_9BACT|nr:zinc metalloprotease HtpX [Candidatus Desulfobia pelagia]